MKLRSNKIFFSKIKKTKMKNLHVLPNNIFYNAILRVDKI